MKGLDPLDNVVPENLQSVNGNYMLLTTQHWFWNCAYSGTHRWSKGQDHFLSYQQIRKKLFDKDRLAFLVHNYQLSVKYGFDSSFPQEPGFIEYFSVLFSLSFMRTKHFFLSKEWDIIWKIYSYKPCFIYFILLRWIDYKFWYLC